MQIHKPSAGWYGIAFLMLLVFGIVAPVSLFVTLLVASLGGDSFSVPGSFSWNAEKPGPYVVWGPADAPLEGIGVCVREKAGGPHLPFTADTSREETIGGSSRRSVGSFQVDRPGSYRIDVTDPSARGSYYVHADIQWRSELSGLGILAGLGIGFIGGPLLAIATFIRRFRAKRALRRAARASSPSAARGFSRRPFRGA